ncbi:MAG: hypothetical protein AB1498_08605 [bacterium]
MGQNLDIKFYFVLVTLILIVINTDILSVSLDRNPHDREFTCNKCHGINSKYGQPETGKHKDHLDEINMARFSKFQNKSYRDLEDKNGNFITRWDMCDECHYDKDVGNNIEHHMDGVVQVTLDKFGGTFSSAGSCSLVNCHNDPNLTRSWGGKSQSYSTESFVRDYIYKNCVQCHSSAVSMARDTRETVILNKSVQRLCMDDCHNKSADNEIKVNHPLNVKPSPILFEAMKNQSEFENFPLDEWDSMTCNTCHDPHGESCQSCHFDFNNEKIYPNGQVIKKATVFLRSSNGDLDEYDYEKHTYGDNPLDFKRVADKFCKVCHDLKTQNRVRIDNPHWERQCLSCHKELPYNINEICVSWKVNNFNRVLLRESVDIYSKYEIKVLCQGCHEKSNHLHPLDVEPKKNIALDIPLDRWKSITCYTCHDAHLPYGETVLDKDWNIVKKDLPNYRRKNNANDLCQVCHDADEKFKNKNPHIENKCKFCHVVLPELTEANALYYNNNLINRCNVCHREDKNTHLINVVPKMELNGFPLAIGNKINCATCHAHHEPLKLLFVDKLKKGEKSFCFNCHE